MDQEDFELIEFSNAFIPKNDQEGSIFRENIGNFIDLYDVKVESDVPANLLNYGKRKLSESNFDSCFEEDSKKMCLLDDLEIRYTDLSQPSFSNDSIPNYQDLDVLLNETMSSLPSNLFEQFSPDPKKPENLEVGKDLNLDSRAEILDLNLKLQERIIAYLKELDLCREENLRKQTRCQEQLRNLSLQKITSKSEPNPFNWFGIPYFKERILVSSRKTQEPYNMPGKLINYSFLYIC